MTYLEKCLRYVKWWGNGGGCFSLKQHIEDILEEYVVTGDEDERDTIINYLRISDPGFGCEAVYQNVINSMVENIENNPESYK